MGMKTVFRIILGIAIVFLAVMVYRSIMRPEKYRMIYQSRHDEIRDRLETLRTAQAVYKNEFKKYAGNVDVLYDFVNNGTITIEKNIGEIAEGQTEEQALKAGTLRKEQVHIPAKDKVLESNPSAGVHLKNFHVIPFTDGKKFHIDTTTLKNSTYSIPVYRIDVPIADILANINRSINADNPNILEKFYNYVIYNGLDEEKTDVTGFKPMYLGSLNEANLSGSWE